MNSSLRRIVPSGCSVVAVVLQLLLFLSISSSPGAAALAFRLPTFPSSFPKLQLPRFVNGGGTPPPQLQQQQKQLQQQLLQAIRGTNRGKTATVTQQQSILQLVRQLELDCPAPLQLLTDPDTALQYLNGTWYLQYTSPSQIIESKNNDNTAVVWTPEYATEEEANIPTSSFQARGTVTAAGVTIDTSAGQVQQTIDVVSSRVENIVLQTNWQIRAAGTFRPSRNVPTRAVVAFDTLQVQLFNNQFLTLDLGWIFDIVAAVRNSRENGWLETTFVNEQVRIGRGNKGTMFVLTRQADPYSSSN